MEPQDLLETKSLPFFSIQLDTNFTLNLKQQNNSNSHGTTVWDSAKLLGHYLFSSLKRPRFKDNKIQNKKTCLELGSGCGLGGIIMASLGYDSTLSDLPEVIELVTRENTQNSIKDIESWWYSIHHSAFEQIDPPKFTITSIDWLNIPESTISYDYILASDCIYEISLVEPLLSCIKKYSSHITIVLIAVERRDDVVINSFIKKANLMGFSANMVLKKLLSNCHYVNNDDVEIWKLKLKKIKNK